VHLAEEQGTIMWDVIKTAVTGIKDALGIELPEIPVDLASLTDAADAAVTTATESAAEVVGTATESLPDVTAVTDAATAGLTDVTDAATAALPAKP
jgi:hypothetical protein